MVKSEKHQGAEEKILSAARKIFTTKGMAGARMQDIANEAGINKALLHYYYRDKEKLFETIPFDEQLVIEIRNKMSMEIYNDQTHLKEDEEIKFLSTSRTMRRY